MWQVWHRFGKGVCFWETRNAVSARFFVSQKHYFRGCYHSEKPTGEGKRRGQGPETADCDDAATSAVCPRRAYKTKQNSTPEAAHHLAVQPAASQSQRWLFATLGFCLWGLFEGSVQGGDVGRAFDVFAVHQFFHGAELDARVFLPVHFVLIKSGARRFRLHLARGRLQGNQNA